MDRLTKAIKAGNTLEASCKYAGVAYSTFRFWVLKGEDMIKKKERGETGIKKEFIEFLEILHAAEAEAQINLVTKINIAGEKDWRAYAFILERRFGKDWAKKVHLEESGSKEIKIVFEDEDANHNETENDIGD